MTAHTSEYSSKRSFDGITIPRRINTPDGLFVRISDVISGHAIVRNISQSQIGLVNLKTKKMSLTIAEFLKWSGRKDHLCYHSNKGNFVIYKPTESASEIYIIKSCGSTFSSKVSTSPNLRQFCNETNIYRSIIQLKTST